MPQNRNKLIELLIGNLSNSIVHKILEEAINKPEIIEKYREKINPAGTNLPEKDILYIKEKIIKKVKAELLMRINKGYEDIDLNLIEIETKKALKQMKISS